VAVAYSGGRDSSALLHATLAVAPPGIKVIALHVHHGLSPLADEWLAHCEAQCALWARSGLPIEFAWTRLVTGAPRGQSVEAWARTMRYRALRRMALDHGADLVLLGHHRRDQAETFLLQALRGAGVTGLAGMPVVAHRDGIVWLRPWLERPRLDIEAYAKRFRLKFVHDHSNDDPRYARSRLRVQVWPALERAFAHVESALADSARWAQQANACLSELARQDLEPLLIGDRGLDLKRWFELSSARRGNVLRAWLRLQAGRVAPATLVSRLLVELRPRGVAAWHMDGAQLRSYRGILRFSIDASPARTGGLSRATRLAVHAPGVYPVSGWAGCLHVEKADQGGVPIACLAELELRPLQGAVQFQAGPGRPPRSLKKQYQTAGVPAWERQGPLLYSRGQLVFAPGLGLDARAIAIPGQPQAGLRWVVDEVGWTSTARIDR
jgi:tRNA(Ile)-lysidine synthase